MKPEYRIEIEIAPSYDLELRVWSAELRLTEFRQNTQYGGSVTTCFNTKPGQSKHTFNARLREEVSKLMGELV